MKSFLRFSLVYFFLLISPSQTFCIQEGFLVLDDYISNTISSSLNRLYIEPKAEFSFGKYAGTSTLYGNLGLWVYPKNSSLFQPFLDIEALFFQKNQWGCSTGVGVRYFGNPSIVYGANVYFDSRRIKTGNINQFGLGIELLSDILELRVNGYFPFQNQIQGKKTKTVYTGGYFIVMRPTSFPYRGVDVEFGHTLRFQWLSVYGALGAYYYKNDLKSCCSGMSNRLFGAQGCLEINYEDFIILENIYSNDKVNKNNYQVKLVVEFPLSQINTSYAEKFRKVRRKWITYNKACESVWNW